VTTAVAFILITPLMVWSFINYIAHNPRTTWKGRTHSLP